MLKYAIVQRVSHGGENVSVKIQVLDQNNKPVKGVEVHVSWQSGGYSSRETDASGIADLQVRPGTASYIQVGGKDVAGTIWLDDGVHTVYRR